MKNVVFIIYIFMFFTTSCIDHSNINQILNPNKSPFDMLNVLRHDSTLMSTDSVNKWVTIHISDTLNSYWFSEIVKVSDSAIERIQLRRRLFIKDYKEQYLKAYKIYSSTIQPVLTFSTDSSAASIFFPSSFFKEKASLSLSTILSKNSYLYFTIEKTNLYEEPIVILKSMDESLVVSDYSNNYYEFELDDKKVSMFKLDIKKVDILMRFLKHNQLLINYLEKDKLKRSDTLNKSEVESLRSKYNFLRIISDRIRN